MQISPLKNICVSVIMITYNHEKFLKQAIEGVLMQQCSFDIELIIANDCSPDNTDLIVQDIINNHPNGSWINYITRKKNIGGQLNFINAFERCQGKYIAHCEGDDFWTDSHKLQKQVEFLESEPEYVLCFHKVNILKPDGQLVEDYLTQVPENYENIETLARLGNYIHTPSVVYRNIIKKLPFELTFSPIGDFFLYMMLAQHGKLKYFEENMCVYRYGVGIFSSSSKLSMAKSNLNLFTFLLSYFKDENINKIILERHLNGLIYFENLIRKEYSEAFVSDHLFFKFLKKVKKFYLKCAKKLKIK